MKSIRYRSLASNLLLAFLICLTMEVRLVLAQISATPPNFKIAFIGDQGLGANAQAVLNLIKAEGAQAVLHLGDLDYKDDPAAWEAQINGILGADFPYFACIGNHDEKNWAGTDGYQKYLQDRLIRLGISWEGDLGVQSALRYQGIFMVLTAAGITGSGHEAYIRHKLAADHSIWSIAGWHKNMRLMQVGDKDDETGWGVYEEARMGGAIIATAHEHSYSRTYLLSSIPNQTVASQSDPLVLTKGATFVFVSGLGGSSVRNQELAGDCWATIYTSNQGGTYGALFGVFNVNGVANLADFYFKNIAGSTVDRFSVVSNVEADTAVDDRTTGAVVADFVLEQNSPNPFGSEGSARATAGGTPSTTIRFQLLKPAHVNLTIFSFLGQQVRTLVDHNMPAGGYSLRWDGSDDAGRQLPGGLYLYRLRSENRILTKKLLYVN